MTKKDYELIAKGLNNGFAHLVRLGIPMSDIQKRHLVNSVSDLLAQDNERFDLYKFERATF